VRADTEKTEAFIARDERIPRRDDQRWLWRRNCRIGLFSIDGFKTLREDSVSGGVDE
jgi:hypothetical protein